MKKNKFPTETKTLETSAEAGSTIGHYHLLQKIGEGGMGEVWVAEQKSPIQRKVAFKIIKIGMDTKQVVARFESERQALAMMDHPAIAKVFDAGATEQGRPYFVMEYVKGIPITTHCDKYCLSTRERLQLFIQVCEGVQHAHQKAIIHRDLKPSNILVEIQDGKAVPKIIDFGVAKATAFRLTERTMFTEMGVLIGTPEYMSPEQAEMSGQNIDTRTDVYSLGVMLYELLVGALPFESKDLRGTSLDEIRRKIREQDPPRPSTKLSSMGGASTVVAQHRREEPATLVRQLKGDLDWITMKALEKDRTRRYGSPSELAADIERFLLHQPVIARPPSTVYRTKKFVRRHRLGVSVVATAFVVLVAFAVTTAVQAGRISRERDRANREAETSRQVSEFLTGLFKVSDPSEARGNSITAREILDRGATRINRELQGQPLVQAELMDMMGQVYESLGLYDAALPLLETALTTRKKYLGEMRLEVAATIVNIGSVLWHKGEYEKAKTLLEQGLAIREKSLGPDHPLVASSLHNLGNLYWSQGNYDQARLVLERALSIREKAFGPEHSDVASTLNTLGAIAYRQGNLTEADRLWQRTLAIREKMLGPDHPWVAQTLNNLAIVHTYSGDPAGARPLLERVVRIQEKVLGPNHPDLASGLMNLGDAIYASGDRAGAKPFYARAVAIMETSSPGNPELARFLDRLATVTLEENDSSSARRLYERSLELREKTLGLKHHELAESLGGLANCAYKDGEYKKAEALYERALALSRKPDGGYYPHQAVEILKHYAVFLRATHREARAAEAEALLHSLETKQ